MNELAKEKLKITLLAIVFLLPFCFGTIISLLILPENCNLLDNAEGPFSCDSIPNHCCGDKTTVFYAQIIFWLGVGLTVAAYMVSRQKNLQDKFDGSLKIFD